MQFHFAVTDDVIENSMSFENNNVHSTKKTEF